MFLKSLASVYQLCFYLIFCQFQPGVAYKSASYIKKSLESEQSKFIQNMTGPEKSLSELQSLTSKKYDIIIYISLKYFHKILILETVNFTNSSMKFV